MEDDVDIRRKINQKLIRKYITCISFKYLFVIIVRTILCTS